MSSEASDGPIGVEQLPSPASTVPDPPRSVALRRVPGWRLSEALLRRWVRRPAGNSRAFWRRMEADDPFLHAPPGPAHLLHDHEVSAAERLSRVEPPPRAVRPAEVTDPRPRPKSAAPPPPKAPSPPPKPPTQPRPEAPAPRPTPAVTPDPRTAPPPAPVDRRPPIIPQGNEAAGGRVRVTRPPGGLTPPKPPAPPAAEPGRSAAEIRAEKEAARAKSEPPPPPALRNLDSVLGLFADLAAAQASYEQDKAAKERGEGPVEPSRPPAPRPTPPPSAPKAAPAAPRPAPAPTPAPPRPAPASPPARQAAEPPRPTAPSAPARAGDGLNDLFGGDPNEGRVRIGKRTTNTKT